MSLQEYIMNMIIAKASNIHVASGVNVDVNLVQGVDGFLEHKNTPLSSFLRMHGLHLED